MIELLHGDCLEAMKKLPNNCIDLCYADPPFFTQSKRKSRVTEFNDKWASLEEYVCWIKDRVKEIYRLLINTGSFYFHCDWHAGHYLKIMCDKVFGYDNFQNEIIWAYKTGGATKRRWNRKHDTIFLYTKSDKYTFNLERERIYYKKSFFTTKKDEQGRWYLDALPVDTWQIPSVINVSKERTDYPTQKPEVLLEKIIKASSNENDLVLDPVCGSGTTGVACKKLNRNFIGIDSNLEAIKISKERLGIK